VLLKNQTKKIIKQKQEKNSIQSKNWKKSWFPSCVDIWKIEKELNPGKKIYYIPLPYHDDDIRYDDHLQIKKKMIVICLLKKNQNDMI